MNGDDRDQDQLPRVRPRPYPTAPPRDIYAESPEAPQAPAGLPAAASEAQTLPTTPAAAPSAPPPPSYYLERRRNELTNELRYPHRAETTLGRIGQTIGRIGETVGTALFPGVAEAIPESRLAKRLELEKVTDMLGQQQQREAGIAETGARTEETKARTAALGHGQFGPPSMVSYTTPSGGGEPIVKFPVEFPQAGEVEWRAPGTPGFLLPSTPQATGAPPETPGGLPKVGGLAPPTAAPTPPPGWSPPVTTYGAPKAGAQQLTPQEIAQQNAENQAYYQSTNPGQTLPPAFQLQPGATRDDQARIFAALEGTERGAATQAQREFTNQMRTQDEERRKEEAGAKWVRAVDNEGRVHYITRGDYDARARDFQPNPGALLPGALDKATDHATVLNEMQARLNSAAQAAGMFNFDDLGQKSIVIQALQQVEQSYPDKVLGIPIMDFVAKNLKQLGLSGATPETREYVIDLLSLRESMLGLPKEITGGSRQMQSSIEALYATLPGGETPDRKWAMKQFRTVQSIMDRLRGTRVPIIEGMPVQQKVPELYQHALRSPKTGHEIFSDDGKNWFDEDGRPIRGKE